MNRRRRLLVVAGLLLVVALVLFAIWPAGGDRDPAGEVAATSRSSGRVTDAVGPSVSSDPPSDAGTAVTPSVVAGRIDADDARARSERARELRDAPETQLVCEVGVPGATGPAYLAIGGHSDFNGRRVEVHDGKAYIPLVYDLGDLGEAEFSERSGVFSLPGYGPVAIAWSDPPADGGNGSCTAVIEPESGRSSLTGTLTLDPSGAPAAGGWVEGCGNLAFADHNGIVHIHIVSDPCTLVAMRQDGLLRSVSEPVAVTPVVGGDVVVDLVIPEAERGGLGVRLTADESGIVIEALIAGGPAVAAGLEAGDRVLEVDGESTGELDLREFVRAVGGAAGTDVSLTVDRGGERLEFTLTREVLSPG